MRPSSRRPSGACPGSGRPAARGKEIRPSNQVKKVEDAVRVLEEMMKESDKSIPVGLIEDCAGLAIIPDVIKAGLFIGGRHGKGVLLVRTNGAAGRTRPSSTSRAGASAGRRASNRPTSSSSSGRPGASRTSPRGNSRWARTPALPPVRSAARPKPAPTPRSRPRSWPIHGAAASMPG